jgi:hypothetical protein
LLFAKDCQTKANRVPFAVESANGALARMP